MAAALYAYMWRPEHPGAGVAPHDASSLRSFGWFITRGGLVMALAGLVVLLWTRFRASLLLMTALLTFAAVFFYKLRIVPDFFWASRRFVPVILPGAIICIAAFLAWLADVPDRGPRRVVQLVFASALTLFLPVSFALADAPIWRHVEYRGVLDQLRAFARSFGPRDLLLVESRYVSDLHVLAVPLAYVYDKSVLVLYTAWPDKAMFHEFLEDAHRRYDRIFFAGGAGTEGNNLVSKHLRVEPVRGYRFQLPEYEAALNAYPRQVRFKEFDFGLYRFEQGETVERPFALDVGTDDDFYVFRFHAKEQQKGVTFRWTRRLSLVSVLGLPRASRAIVLRLNDGGRPAAAGPARVSVSLADRPLGTVAVAQGFHDYSLPLTPELLDLAARSEEPLLLRLISTTWMPRDVLGTPDDRQLGVMVDRIDVR
jgi:hypothetical protein